MKKFATLVAAATTGLLAAPSAYAGSVMLEGHMDGWIIVQRWIIVQVGGLFGA